MNTLKITFDNLAEDYPLNFVGGKPRHSTITSVVFLAPNILACCHFNGKCMFLVNFDIKDQSFKIMQKLDTTFNNEKCETDLMAYDNNGRIITSNFYKNTCSLYNYKDNTIGFVRDLNYNAGSSVHGVKFINNDIVAVTSRTKNTGIHFFDINTCSRTNLYSTPEPAIQDLCLISEDLFAMISCFGTASFSKKSIHDSKVSLIKYNLKENSFHRINEIDFKSSHLDNIVHYKGVLYITDQFNNKIIRLNSSNLQNLGDLTDLSFPHGVDVKYDLIAITNYGLNNIIIKSVQ